MLLTEAIVNAKAHWINAIDQRAQRATALLHAAEGVPDGAVHSRPTPEYAAALKAYRAALIHEKIALSAYRAAMARENLKRR